MAKRSIPLSAVIFGRGGRRDNLDNSLDHRFFDDRETRHSSLTSPILGQAKIGWRKRCGTGNLRTVSRRSRIGNRPRGKTNVKPRNIAVPGAAIL